MRAPTFKCDYYHVAYKRASRFEPYYFYVYENLAGDGWVEVARVNGKRSSLVYTLLNLVHAGAVWNRWYKFVERVQLFQNDC